MDNYLTEVLSDPLIAALTVPLLFLLAGGFGKKLVRGANDWHRKDFYLGVNATLATMSATLIYLFDITKSITESNAPQNTEKLIASGVFLAISFFLFMFILGIHQNWESKNNHRAGQWVWLVIGSNAIGLGLMSFFILVIKGV
jgi:uncharacterized membrane protein